MGDKKCWVGLGMLALTVMGAAPVVSWGQQAATQPVATTQDAELCTMIRDLGDANAAVSDPAAQKLNALPHSALAKVWSVEQAMMDDGTIKVRAIDRLGQWEEKIAQGPTLITLDVKNATLDDLIAEISKQAQIDIRVQPERRFRNNMNQKEKLITLRADKQPFWLVMRDVSTQTGLTPENRGGTDNAIYLNTYNASENGLGCMVGEGPLYVLGNSIERSYYTNLQQRDEKNRSTQSFSMRITALADPGLHILNNSWKTDVTEATDDKGHSLIVENGGSGPNWGSNGWLCSVGIPLQYPGSDAGEKIKVLKGTISTEIVLRQDHVQFDDLKAQATKELGDMDVTLQGFKAQGDRNFSLKIKLEKGGAMDALWAKLGEWGRGPTIKLVDAGGKEYQQNGSSSSGNNMTRTYEPSFYRPDNSDGGVKLGAPARVLITIPLKTQKVVVPFEFHDLKMP